LHTRAVPVVHGDMKGSNIIVEQMDSHYRPKLLDFGLARVLTSSAKPLGGTLRWTAPEVIRSRRNGASATVVPHPSADLFSFGRVVYLVGAEKLPLEGVATNCVKGVVLQNAEQSLEWPHQEDAIGFVARCKEVSEDCCQTDPRKRSDMCAVLNSMSSWPERVLWPGAGVSFPGLFEFGKHGNEEVFWRSVSALRRATTKLPCFDLAPAYDKFVSAPVQDNLQRPAAAEETPPKAAQHSAEKGLDKVTDCKLTSHVLVYGKHDIMEDAEPTASTAVKCTHQDRNAVGSCRLLGPKPARGLIKL